MDFEVYCDESRQDVLCSESTTSQYLVIGSLWLPAAARDLFKQEIHALRDRHKIGGEFKWRKISASRQAFYTELVEWFFSKGDQLRFRCIAVDRNQVDLGLHNGDQELGFYKFYYQMLHQWILDFNSYAVFCDYKSNREQDRLHVLQRCLDHANLSSAIERVQAVRSRESVLLQLTDVLTGAASARLNDALTEGTTKTALVEQIEALLGRRIRHTVRGEQKFNVFVIDLSGGW